MATTQIARKRKRDEGSGEDVLMSRLGGKIHHEKRLVHKACKKARIFEIQKVVQRLKSERNKDAEDSLISDYEAQLSSLKTINDDTIGNTAFRSRILKDHILRANEAVLSCVKQLEPHLPLSVEPGSTLAKIQSKLLSSKVLSAQITASVESLRVLADPTLKLQKGKPAKDDERSQKKLQKSKGKSSSRQPTLFEEDKEPSPMVDDTGWDSGTVEMNNGIGDDASSEYRSLGSPEPLSDLDAQAETDEDAGHDGSNKIKRARSPLTGSTFLPSLSVGFIQGSYDSDFDDAAETKAADMPRKNRRGQRARREIWEKKYGRHANHKKKEAEERAAAFAKKAAKYQTSNAIKWDAVRRIRSGQEGSGANSINLHGAASSRSQDDKPLHPSWEAKRNQKDKDRGNIVPSQGKKIKF